MTLFLFSDIVSIIILATLAGTVAGIIGALIAPEKTKWFFRTYGIWIGFLLSLGSIIGSLIFSQIFQVPPCNLCWWQRIFLYPQVIIFGLALLKQVDVRSVYRISLALSAIGFLFSLYHYLLQFVFGGESIFCVAGSASCSSIDVISFGFVTIPFMAGITFLALILNGVLNRE